MPPLRHKRVCVLEQGGHRSASWTQLGQETPKHVSDILPFALNITEEQEEDNGEKSAK